MRPTRVRILSLTALAGLALSMAGCGTRSPGAGGQPGAPGTPAATAPPSSPPASGATGPGTATAPVWPVEATTVPATGGTGTGAVLHAIRAGQHGGYERIVLEFQGGYGEVTVHYVPVVRADPSDRVVPLTGRSYLSVVVHDAAAHWNAVGVTGYRGPATVSPGLPTVKQVSIAGDYENVLSFGVGLSRTAGFQVTRMTGPDRLVIDVAEPPAWQLWPETSQAAAQATQAGFEQGHQPWRGDPVQVATAYGKAVYGWSAVTVTRVGADRYRLSGQGSPDSVTVRLVQPFAGTRPHSVYAVADTR